MSGRMARRSLIRSSEVPYHVTNRSNNREFFYLSESQLWEIFIECLGEIREKFECCNHAFVLMSNHYHLLISTPRANLDLAMQHLQREVARKANRKVARTNHFFGSRYKWTLVVGEEYYWNSVKYVFRNPVRAGLCKRVEQYQFSSLNCGQSQWLMTDFFRDRSKPVELDRDWLNEPFLKEKEIAISKALRRSEFKLPRLKNGNAMILDPAHYKK